MKHVWRDICGKIIANRCYRRRSQTCEGNRWINVLLRRRQEVSQLHVSIACEGKCLRKCSIFRC